MGNISVDHIIFARPSSKLGIPVPNVFPSAGEVFFKRDPNVSPRAERPYSDVIYDGDDPRRDARANQTR